MLPSPRPFRCDCCVTSIPRTLSPSQMSYLAYEILLTWWTLHKLLSTQINSKFTQERVHNPESNLLAPHHHEYWSGGCRNVISVCSSIVTSLQRSLIEYYAAESPTIVGDIRHLRWRLSWDCRHQQSKKGFRDRHNWRCSLNATAHTSIQAELAC